MPLTDRCLFCKKEENETLGYVQNDKHILCANCILSCYDILQLRLANPIEVQDLNDLISHLKKYVYGQDKLVEFFNQIHIYNTLIEHNIKNTYLKDTPLKYKNCLLIGESGSGKTYFIKKYCEYIKKNYTIIDCAQLTGAGYRGFCVDNILTKLYMECDKKLEKMDSAIIVLDEFDKIPDRDGAFSSTIFSGILKLLEGSVVSFPEVYESSYKSDWIQFDTRNIKFIFCGVFEQLLKYCDTGTVKVGFHSINNKSDNGNHDTVEQLLLKHYFTPEIMGRLDEVFILNKLTKEHYLNSFKYSEESPFFITQVLLRGLNWDVNFKEGAYDNIIEKVIKSKVGYRLVNKLIFEKTKHLYSKTNESMTRVEIE